ncbi:unnamed protein product [Phyllotreta striolata]|uniref:Uncharacterized protein n=1 Tax=Phyllotreta striolata TaxID=444603 RepID=A0A9N9TRC6_PHYSR|nr:unnamed protein product [Phyllotreta striolata]
MNLLSKNNNTLPLLRAAEEVKEQPARDRYSAVASQPPPPSKKAPKVPVSSKQIPIRSIRSSGFLSIDDCHSFSIRLCRRGKLRGASGKFDSQGNFERSPRRTKMGLVKCAVFVLLVGAVVRGENEGENVEDGAREMREFNPEGWRAVETFPTGDLGWMPREDAKDGEQVKLKRRRLRKRKRRPPTQEPDGEEAPPRRRLRPFRLDQAALPWEEIGDGNDAPHNRRRIPLPYTEDAKGNSTEEEATLESSMMVEGKLDAQKSIADLKSLLKQSGGRLSLSEILQQKNLSLAELLQGNEKAISALTEKPQTTTELSNTHKHPATTEETALTREQTTEAQRKRLAVLQPKENKIFTTLIKFDVINEPTTDRRIFIPANSKFTGVEYTNIEEDNTATSPITTTTTTEKPTTTTTKSTKYRSKLPTTNAKLRVTTKKTEREPVKIAIKDVAGFPEEPQGPMKVSLDIEKMFEMNETKFQSETTTNASEDTNTTYVTAKQEIMEVMKDPASREKLSRILQHRNMTIEELVEQRERGSSQLHLADIFHNKTREPEPQEEPFVGQLSPEFFQNAYRQQKSTRLEEPTPTKTASTEASTTPTTTSTTTTSSTVDIEEKEPFPIISVEINKKTGSFPWKQLYPDLFPETNDIVTEFSNSEYLEKMNMNTIKNNDEGFFNSIPSGVKSALFVSLAIIGLSIVVFLAVLLALKWIQSKNKSMNYCSSLTAKLRAPMMLQGRPTTAIKSFMNETLGRKKNYYKSTLQSMSDEIWNANRDRKESF